jgi:hypothetical protein
MNPEKNELYQIVWTQTYSMKPLQDAMDELVENLLMQSTEFIEANQVINRIKSM